MFEFNSKKLKEEEKESNFIKVNDVFSKYVSFLNNGVMQGNITTIKSADAQKLSKIIENILSKVLDGKLIPEKSFFENPLNNLDLYNKLNKFGDDYNNFLTKRSDPYKEGNA